MGLSMSDKKWNPKYYATPQPLLSIQTNNMVWFWQNIKEEKSWLLFGHKVTFDEKLFLELSWKVRKWQ